MGFSLKKFAEQLKQPGMAPLIALADPFGIDPMGAPAHNMIGDLLGIGKVEGKDLNTQLKEQQQAQKPRSVAPDQAQATMDMLGKERDMLRAKRASGTIFGSQAGLSNSPTLASTVLLGM